MIQGAWGWCTGMTKRDGIGREVAGVFRMGNTYTPVVDSCQCMAKPIQYCKVKKKKKTLGREYPLKEEMAAHYIILAWKIP